MIRIAIVEDEASYAQKLVEYLRRYELEKQEGFTISMFTDGDGIVNGYRPYYDIILMDVQMPFTDGMSAAAKIRSMDSEVIIVFITNMRQYAIQGYTVQAFDYVIKPINYFAFSARLSRAIEKIKRRSPRSILLDIRGGVLRVDMADVCYIESQGHTLIYHTMSGDYEASGTMKDTEAKFAGTNFVRGNKGYLINLAHVSGVQDGCAIVRGQKLVLSRARKNAFMEALTDYWSEAK